MPDELKSLLRTVVTKPRTLKAQTERHIHEYFDEADEDLQHFFDTAADRLEEYELDTLFGPIFTPSADEKATFSALLSERVPDSAELDRLVAELAAEGLRTEIQPPDGRRPLLPVHAVMLERYVRLQRFTHAPTPDRAATLRAAVPPELHDFVLAIARHRAFGTPSRQDWLAEYLAHVASSRTLTLDDLHMLTELLASQRDLQPDVLKGVIADTLESARTALRSAQLGHQYLSSDVAQHHQFRGEGVVDKKRVSDKKQELALLEQLQRDLLDFLDRSPEPDAQPVP